MYIYSKRAVAICIHFVCFAIARAILSNFTYILATTTPTNDQKKNKESVIERKVRIGFSSMLFCYLKKYVFFDNGNSGFKHIQQALLQPSYRLYLG